MGKKRPTKRGIRVLDWSIRDEAGDVWDRQAGWVRAQDIGARLSHACRAIVHIEANREVRNPLRGELENLIPQVSDDGGSGTVCVAEYRRGSELLLMFSVVDGPQPRSDAKVRRGGP